MTAPVRIGNCSGFYGDRIAAAKEMVAGGLNPAGLASKISELSARLGLSAKVAHVEGDDLLGDTSAILPPVGDSKPVSANAYLGGWGIAEGLSAGADVVVTGRVTDASLVVGPAAWWHGLGLEDFDALAGAVVAGHIIECGPQATGGSYSFLREVTDRRYPGFPIAEVEADGSSVITKHENTGGLVSVGTVTAQLLYEIDPPAYLGPDVTTHFDSIRLEQQGEHRVRISRVTGSAPPSTLKVALNDTGGFRNTMTMVLTGLDIEEKAAWAEQQIFDVLGGRDRFAEVDVRLLRFDTPDAGSNDQAIAHLRVTVKDPDPRKVGREFSGGIMEIALAGYSGFHTTTPPSGESAYGVCRPAIVPRGTVTQTVVLPDGGRRTIADPPTSESNAGSGATTPGHTASAPGGPTLRAPIGAVLGARSGDKGGHANIGLWARDDAGYAWARDHLDVERVRALLGAEARDLTIETFELPNLRALNFLVHGLLGEGVASCTRPDPISRITASQRVGRVPAQPGDRHSRGTAHIGQYPPI